MTLCPKVQSFSIACLASRPLVSPVPASKAARRRPCVVLSRGARLRSLKPESEPESDPGGKGSNKLSAGLQKSVKARPPRGFADVQLPPRELGINALFVGTTLLHQPPLENFLRGSPSPNASFVRFFSFPISISIFPMQFRCSITKLVIKRFEKLKRPKTPSFMWS